MARCNESRLLDMPVEAAFDLIANVECYPEFLPMWQRAAVVASAEDGYETEQTVGVGMMAHRFRTRTALERPRCIVVSSDDPLFRAFVLRWTFHPEGSSCCRVDFALECEVAEWWLRPAIEAMMATTAAAMIDAFEARARSLTPAPRRAA
jgi:coenzyme Q-binding protein COQ10